MQLKNGFLSMVQGDTEDLVVNLSGETFTASDKAQITFSMRDGTVLMNKVANIASNVVTFSFDIDDTKDIPEGDYKWEIQIVTGASVTSGRIVSGTKKYTPYEKAMPLRINDALNDITEGM